MSTKLLKTLIYQTNRNASSAVIAMLVGGGSVAIIADESFKKEDSCYDNNNETKHQQASLWNNSKKWFLPRNEVKTTLCEPMVKQRRVSFNTLQRRRTIRSLDRFANKTNTLEDKYEINWEAPPLGEGAFGSVFLAKERKTEEAYALKKISKRYTNDTSFQREMAALLRIRAFGGHPNIAGLHENFEEKEHYYLVLDLVAGGEMFDHLINNGAYSEADAARLVREVASALAFMHGIGMVHGDLKPENLMLSTPKASNAVIKVVDFGCAEVTADEYELDDWMLDEGGSNYDEDELAMERARRSSLIAYTDKQAVKHVTSVANTPAYSPPEAFDKGTQLHPNMDSWALGVILYIMLTGLHPFDLSGQSTDQEIEQRVRNHEPPPLADSPITAHLSSSAIDLIRNLLSWDSNSRMTAQQMLDHPWVRGETASSDIIVDSDKKLSQFRVFRSKLEAKVFADIVSWSDDSQQQNQTESPATAYLKTSLMERAFLSLDQHEKGFLTPQDLSQHLHNDPKQPDNTNNSQDSLSLSAFSDLLSENMQNVYFPKNDIIYNEGDIGDHMFFINSGTVLVSTKDGSKVKRSQGEFFGEGALLHPQKIRSATIQTLTPLHAIRISREYFEKYLAEQSGLKLDLREKDKRIKRNRAKTILRLQNNLKELDFHRNDFLFKVGEEGDALYILEQGKIDVQVSGHTVFFVTRPGDLCGEHSLIMGRPRNTDAVCKTPTCKVLAMKARDFYSLLDSSPTMRGSLREMCLRREFQKALVKKTQKRFPSLKDLKQAFDAVDVKQSGFISVEQVRDLLLLLDSTISETDIMELLGSLGLDSKENNAIGFEEFKKIFGMEELKQ